ncbi:enoyl-CoA hydratase/isomeras-like protein [Leptodontidium sp. MPI-SDFR-AT-0119]|nr:enoyl-CoA hydratase/isomeras-like protein [Leptodontidium sp. MPI-SDFR-AT-0119]
MSPPPSLPPSYAALPFSDIRLSHIPSTSPSPTPVILITLYRPQKNNAFTDVMHRELSSVIDTLSADPRVKAIVVTGHGRMFCAGADLDTGLSYETETVRDHRDGGGQVALALHRCNKPIIAAINGSAVGVGITMTLPMSIRIVSSTAKIGFVFARRGIVMEAASSFFLPRLIGYSRATHLVTTGEVLPATNRLLDGLFSEILPQERVLDRAIEIAEDVARNTSLVSTTLMRDLMWRGPGSAEATHLLDSKILIGLFGGEDKREGVRSFLEKRSPRFEGTMEGAPGVWPWWEGVDVGVRTLEGRVEGEEKGEGREKEKAKAKL